MIEVSSPDRIVYPATGTTKGQMVGHYAAVAERMLWHCADRPLTLQRFPKGVASKGFMQKNASEYFPEYIGRHLIERADGTTNHPVVNNSLGIEYLANQNTLTFHMPTTTISDSEHPDRMIIDLDPPEDALGIVRQAAWATKELLDELSIPTVPVTTGSKGYHITAMVAPTVEVVDVDELGQLVAAVLAHTHPDVVTTEFRKANRKGRVFCDWLRNRWGSTAVVPWSLRPRSRPSVAVPIRWEELDEIAPDHFELGELPTTDELRGMADDPTDLRPALEALRARAAELGVTVAPFDRFRS